MRAAKIIQNLHSVPFIIEENNIYVNPKGTAKYLANKISNEDHTQFANS